MLRVVVGFSDEDDIGTFDILYNFRQIDGLLVAYYCKLSCMSMNVRNNQKYEYDYQSMKWAHGSLQCHTVPVTEGPKNVFPLLAAISLFRQFTTGRPHGSAHYPEVSFAPAKSVRTRLMPPRSLVPSGRRRQASYAKYFGW